VGFYDTNKFVDSIKTRNLYPSTYLSIIEEMCTTELCYTVCINGTFDSTSLKVRIGGLGEASVVAPLL
jgi:hypothetical protein